MTVGKRLGSDRPSPCIERYVDDSRNRQDAFSRQKLHVKNPRRQSGITVLTVSAVE
jgi:hypothetical protein